MLLQNNKKSFRITSRANFEPVIISHHQQQQQTTKLKLNKNEG